MSVKFFCTALAALFCFMPANAQRFVNLPYQEVAVKTINDKTVFEGAPSFGIPGQPNLPMYVVTFQIPSETNPENIEITVEDPVEKILDGTFYVAPARPPKSSNDTAVGEYPEDVTVYGKDVFFPESWTGKITYSKKRHQQTARVIINACRYNPVTRKIKMLSGGKLILTINGQSGSMQNKKSATLNLQESSIRMMSSSQEYMPSVAVSSAIKPSYVIITTNATIKFLSQLQSFITQKTALNYNVVLVTENTWGGGKGDIASENIRRWLQRNYSDGALNIKYVLLIGDPDPVDGDVPMKMCYPSGLQDPTPSDYYYAELSGNWDYNGDKMYGSYKEDFVPGGADQDAEVVVGRIPFYGNYADLDKILAKSVRYENETSCEWRKKILLPMKPLDATNPSFYLGERVKIDFCDPLGWGSYRLYDEYNSGAQQIVTDVVRMNPLPDRVTCTEKDVTNTWKNDYYGAVLWLTHGYPQGASEVFSTSNSMYLDDNHPSMTFQASCLTARPESSDNLAYSILRNGGITTIGATRVSYGGNEHYFANSASIMGIGYEYMKNLIVNGSSSGEALVQAISSVIPGESTQWANMIMFPVYGCPDMKLNIPSSMPLPLTSLKATPTSPSTVLLNWNEPVSSNATSYTIERKVGNGKFQAVATISAGVKNYTISGLSLNTKFFFRMRGSNGTRYSTYSNIDSTTTFGNIALNKYAFASSNKNQPKTCVDGDLSTMWTASSNYFPQTLAIDLGYPVAVSGCEFVFKRLGLVGDCYDFAIRTSLDKETWTTRFNRAVNSNTSMTQACQFNTTARYVQIYFLDAPQDDSASVREFRITGNKIPDAPVWQSVNYASDNQLTLTWKAAGGAKYYTLKKSASSDGPFIPIAEKITGTKYTTLNLDPDVMSYFAISAANEYGEGSNSLEREERPEYTIPLAPTNLTISLDGRDELKWTDNSRTESGFEIDRSVYGQDNWVTLNYTGTFHEFYDEDRIINDPYKAYKYRIRSYGTGGFSANSNIVITPLHTPSLISTEFFYNSNEIFITWQMSGKTHEGFILERSIGNPNNFQQIASLSPQDDSYQDLNFIANTTYYYRLKAFNALGNSSYSKNLDVTTTRQTWTSLR